MRSEFKRILALAKEGQRAELTVEIEGEQYQRNFNPEERLIVLGGGHIALPLCTFAAALGFAVTVVDDRPSFANRGRFPAARDVICQDFESALQRLAIRDTDYIAVITRGHRFDGDCLRTILPGTLPTYLGLIGSRRRTSGLINLLANEGIERERLRTIKTPIGLDIGALTPEEIAISIVAELVQVRRANTDRHADSWILTNEQTDLELLQFLAEDDTPKALMLVYESTGSTPVKTGSMMAVDANLRALGTIGGGCSENAIMRDAYNLIGTGERQTVNIDMSEDIAAEEGMVCGGDMQVLIVDIQ